MTPEVTARAQQLLADGWSRSEAAAELGLKPDTLRKAIQQGRLAELAPIQREETTIETTTFHSRLPPRTSPLGPPRMPWPKWVRDARDRMNGF